MADVTTTLATLAWGFGLWLAVSVVAAAVIGLWFRSRARANELLAVDERRRAFVEAATSERTIQS
jgi:heme exporter protein D